MNTVEEGYSGYWPPQVFPIIYRRQSEHFQRTDAKDGGRGGGAWLPGRVQLAHGRGGGGGVGQGWGDSGRSEETRRVGGGS